MGDVCARTVEWEGRLGARRRMITDLQASAPQSALLRCVVACGPRIGLSPVCGSGSGYVLSLDRDVGPLDLLLAEQAGGQTCRPCDGGGGGRRLRLAPRQGRKACRTLLGQSRF